MPLPIEPPTGKVIVITGANRGIGLATVHEVQRRGAKVVAGVREPHKMPPISGVTVLQLDARNAESCWTFMAKAEGEHGRIDGLINNAGILLDHNTPVLDLSEDDLKRVLEVNLIAPIRLCQLVTAGDAKPRLRTHRQCLVRPRRHHRHGRRLSVLPDVKACVQWIHAHPRRRTRPEEQCEGQQPRSRLGTREIADLVSISGDGPSGGFFYQGDPREW